MFRRLFLMLALSGSLIFSASAPANDWYWYDLNPECDIKKRTCPNLESFKALQCSYDPEKSGSGVVDYAQSFRFLISTQDRVAKWPLAAPKGRDGLAFYITKARIEHATVGVRNRCLDINISRFDLTYSGTLCLVGKKPIQVSGSCQVTTVHEVLRPAFERKKRMPKVEKLL